MTSREDPRYVRFGRPRKSGHSRDGIRFRKEQGVSVYAGWMQAEDTFVIDGSELNEELGIRGLIYLAAAERPAFFVAGEEVGHGGDGEPLLSVEDVWRVPLSVNITCTDTRTQTALSLWSKSTRNNALRDDVRAINWRIARGGWSPDFEVLELSSSNLSSRETRRKQAKERRRKDQGQARKMTKSKSKKRKKR